MSKKLILGIAALCVVSAFFVGRRFPAVQPTSTDARSGATNHGERAEGSGPLLDSQDQVISRLTAELEAARKENRQLTTSSAALREQVASYEKRFPPTGKAPAGASAFAPKQFEKTVKEVDWPQAGEAAAKMVPLLDQLARDFVAGKPVTTEVGVAIFKLNQSLQNVAVTAIANEVPGAASNGAFTHPVVSLNLIQAALAKAGVPLDESQLVSLREVGDRYVEADARRNAGYDETTYELQKTIDECALKDRMFADVHAVLTGRQSEVLHPEGIRGRLGIDLYSSGTIWYSVSRPVDFTTRQDLAAGLVQQLTAQRKPSEEAIARLTDAARDWANSFSDRFLEASADPVAQASRKSAAGGMMAGWQRVSQATQAAVHQMALNRALVELAGPESDEARRIRASNRLYIPLRRP